jgi:hypothetical protein
VIYFQIAVTIVIAALAAGFLQTLAFAIREPGRAPSATRRGTGAVLMGFAVFIFLMSGTLKLLHVPFVVDEMTSLGLAGWKLNAVGALEILTGSVFAWPRLRALGLLVASAYLGGGICAHFATDQYFAMLPTTIVLGCCWLGAALRHPQVLWSVNGLGRMSVPFGRARDDSSPFAAAGAHRETPVG